MRKLIMLTLVAFYLCIFLSFANTEESSSLEYTVGIDDVLDINILQPEKITTTVIVAPDGTITFPYVGSIMVKDMTLAEIENGIKKGLSDGYMKYPVVSVSLKESRSRRFFVYGEVIKPGAYLIGENTTVLRAISLAGGFSKFGSSSRVKVLRPNKDRPGYETLKVNISGVVKGSSETDLLIQPGDIVVVSEGIL